MKKLLVLALVLSIATIANAGLTLSVTGPQGGETVAVMAAGVTADGYIAVTIAGPDAVVGAFIQGPQAGSMSGLVGMANQLDPELVGEIWAMAISVAPEVYQDGTWLSTGVISHLAATTVTLWSYDGDVTLTPMESVVLPAPEPMTLGLLAIGGLFLRRRK